MLQALRNVGVAFRHGFVNGGLTYAEVFDFNTVELCGVLAQRFIAARTHVLDNGRGRCHSLRVKRALAGKIRFLQLFAFLQNDSAHGSSSSIVSAGQRPVTCFYRLCWSCCRPLSRTLPLPNAGIFYSSSAGFLANPKRAVSSHSFTFLHTRFPVCRVLTVPLRRTRLPINHTRTNAQALVA